MATDGTIVIDIRTSGNDKALEVFKDELMALTATGTSYNVSQSITNFLLQETNSLILTQGLLITGLSAELSTTAVIAQQIFAAQTEITRMSLDTVAKEISEVLVPQLDGLLTWFNTNMPTINTVAGDVFRGMVLALAGIAAAISIFVIPQLTSLFNWLDKNSQKINENFGIAFNGAKTAVGELAASLDKVNSALKTLRETNKDDVEAIRKLKDVLSSDSAIRDFGAEIVNIGLAIIGVATATFMLKSSVLGIVGIVTTLIGLIVEFWPQISAFFAYDSNKPTYNGKDDFIQPYATGTPYIPHDMIALVHEGEMIVPKSQNPYAGANRIKAAMNASNADVAAASANNTNNITYTFNSPKALGMSEILREMRLAEQRKALLGV